MAFKKCSKCFTEFECIREKSGCWCEAVILDEKALAHLKTEFTDCLCSACLRSYAVTAEKLKS